MISRVRTPAPWLLTALVAACGSSERPSPEAGEAPAGAPWVVLFTVDTLRADRLGTYGAGAGASPSIDRLAERSLVFERAYTQATHTHPALSSLFTGLAPPHHGVLNQEGRLAPGITPLAESLQAEGIATGSFVANLCRLQSLERSVFHAGWDERFCAMGEDDHWQWDGRAVDAAMAWLAGREGPTFAWIHLMDPHAEHRPAPDLWNRERDPVGTAADQRRMHGEIEQAGERPGPALRRRLDALYAAEVLGADRQLGRLIEFLEAHPAGREAALIFSSDHGEELYETWAKQGHGLSLTEGVLRVPLLLALPDREPGRIARQVETLQITPTILALFDVAPARALDGPSLLDEGARRPAYSYCGDVVSVRRGDTRAWHTSTKLLRPASFDSWFAVAPYERVPWFRDPWALARYEPEAPSTPLWLDVRDPENEERLTAIKRLVYAHLEGLEAVPVFETQDDPELRAELEALGYF